MSGYTVDPRIRWTEYLPWLIALAAFFALPEYLALGARILIFILFALSLDLILGYGGIITLGHSAFFGLGAYTAGSKYWIPELGAFLVYAATIGVLLWRPQGLFGIRT